MIKKLFVAIVIILVVVAVGLAVRQSSKSALVHAPIDASEGVNLSSPTPIDVANQAPSTATGTTTVQNPGTTSETIQSAAVPLTITQPADKSTTSATTATVRGTTIPNASVFVNEKETKSSASGAFSVDVGLDDGDNVIVVTVNDDAGNYTEKEVTVTVTSG